MEQNLTDYIRLQGDVVGDDVQLLNEVTHHPEHLLIRLQVFVYDLSLIKMVLLEIVVLAHAVLITTNLGDVVHEAPSESHLLDEFGCPPINLNGSEGLIMPQIE